MLSPYADGELSAHEVRRVEAHLASCPSCRAEWARIQAGAALADGVSRVAPADSLWDSVHAATVQAQRGRVPEAGPGARVERSFWTMFPVRLATAAVVLASLFAALFAVSWVTRYSAPIATSAAAVLDTSDEALKRVVKPGELLHRRSRVTRVIIKPGAAPVRHDWRMDSWLGGANLTRSVTRISTSDGRLITASFSATDGARGWSYLSPDYPGELRGVVLEFPFTAEYKQALAGLPAADRARLAPLFDSPSRPDSESLLQWEHRTNRALLTDPGREPSIGQHLTLSLAPAVMPDGESAHRITELVIGTPWMEWRADGTSWAQLARVTTNHYISKMSFLTLKFESDVDLEDGSRRVSATELESIQSVRPDAVPDPFAFELPPGTPTVRVSPAAYLRTLADVLRRSPATPVGTDTRVR